MEQSIAQSRRYDRCRKGKQLVSVGSSRFVPTSRAVMVPRRDVSSLVSIKAFLSRIYSNGTGRNVLWPGRPHSCDIDRCGVLHDLSAFDRRIESPLVPYTANTNTT